MKVRYKYFLLTALEYLVGNVFTKLLSFILLPLYTELIAPELYGIYGVNMSIIQLIVPVVYVAVWNAVFRYSAEAELEQGRYRVISTGVPIMLLGTTMCVLVLIIANLFWNLGNPYLVIIYAIANGWQYYYGYVARSMKDNRIFIISGCVNSTINLLMNWIGIAYFHQGIEVLYYSYIIGTTAQILIIELKFHVWSYCEYRNISRTLLVQLIKFGGPLALNAVMQWLLVGLTQLMIAKMLGTYYNGLFSVAIKFATLISLLVSIFEFAWLEMAYDIVKSANSTVYYKKVINILFVVLMFGSSAMMLSIKLLFPYFIAEAYHECLAIIPYIVYYASANAFSSFCGTIYMSYKSVTTLMGSSLVAGGANLLLLAFLIPNFGFYGALLALVVAGILMMLMRILVLKIKYCISLDVTTELYFTVLCVATILFYSVDYALVDIVSLIAYSALFIIVMRKLCLQYIYSR